MSQAAASVSATTATFVDDVIETSAHTPVLVDFWAPWCGPCKQLMPVLERLAIEYGGRFKLVKVNTDEEPALAQQVGVRSLPTVALFKDGALAGHFIGVQPEAQIRALLDQHVAAPAQGPLPQAELLRARGDYAGARQVLQDALAKDDKNIELQTALAELHVLENDMDGARAVLAELQTREPQHAAVKRLAARLGFSDLLASAPDVRGLRERADQDADARSLLAVHALLAGDVAAAFEVWLEQMRSDRSRKESARQRLVMAFDLLGEAEPAIAQARRAMARLLF